jgi:acyl-coenzyme A thioesterase PaaI-like protein
VDARDPVAGSIYGIWDGSRTDLISYRYLGCSSELRGRHHAEGRMRLRRDMRNGTGLLTAPLAVAMLDTAGINIDRYYQAAPTQVDVPVLDAATDVEEIRIYGTVVREGRTQLFTEARIEDAYQPGRLLALGTVSWSVSGATAEGFVYRDPGSGVPDQATLPPLPLAYDAQACPEGGYMIPGLSTRVGTQALHHGPILVTLEAAALNAASLTVGDDERRIETASTRLVRAARRGPFVARAEVVGEAGDTIACRAEMRDRGADNSVVAVALLRLRGFA